MLLALIGAIACAFAANRVSDSDTEDSAKSGQGETDTSDVGSGGEAAAVQTVKDFYTHAAALDYAATSALLTKEQLASTFSTRDRFVGTFNTLLSVRFTEEPKVEVSGSTAKVTGTTVARHTDRTERNSATWTLVNEDGEWRISGWTVSPISVEPV